MTIKITLENRRARPQKYAVQRSKMGKGKTSPSMIMLVSGIIVLGFILLHLADLRFELRHSIDPDIQPASHTLLVLQDWTSAIVYFLGSIFLGYHIWHAFGSVFQTYGLNHPKYTPKINKLSIILAVLLAIGFASFPVYGILLKLGVLS